MFRRQNMLFNRRNFFSALIGQIKMAKPFAGDETSNDKGYLRLDGSNHPGPAPGESSCIISSVNESVKLDCVGGTITGKYFQFIPFTGSDFDEFAENLPARALGYFEDQTGAISLGFKKDGRIRICKTYTREEAIDLAVAKGYRLDQRFPLWIRGQNDEAIAIDLMDAIIL